MNKLALNPKTFVYGLLLPASGALLIYIYLPYYFLDNHPFHSAIEAIGSFIALIVSYLIFLLIQNERLNSNYTWACSALAGMGILDGFHSVLYAGNQFVWLHSTATFVGGVLFACMWIENQSIVNNNYFKKLPLSILFITILFGFYSIFFHSTIPAMTDHNKEFNFFAKVLNFAGGIGFFIAWLYFAIQYGKKYEGDKVVFANHCLLFGIAGVIFEKSFLWDATWWYWHILRLAAYVVALVYFVDLYKRNIVELRMVNQSLRMIFSSSIGSFGKDFFDDLVKSVNEWLNADCVILGEMVDDNKVNTLSMLLGGEKVDNFSYELAGTPCENVFKKGFCVYEENVGGLFPNDKTLIEMSAEGYIGTPLLNNKGDTLGILCAVFKRKFFPPEETQKLLATIALRTTTEIERMRSDKALKLRADQQSATSRLGLMGLSGMGLDEIFHAAVVSISKILNAEYTKILELLPDEKSLLLREGVGWKEGLVGHATVGTELESQAGYTLKSDQPVIVKNLREESRFSGPPLLHDHGVISGMSVIIRGKDRPFGILGTHSTRHQTFTEDDINFLQSIANVLAETIERKRAEKEHQKMEERLRHTQKLESLGVLAGGIAHDFNNILTGILGNSDLALNDISPASPVRNYIEAIQQETKRAAELSNQMLAYSGKGKFVIENINVNEVIKETTYMIEASISKKHSIKYDLTENIPSVKVDITQIRQVIMNLLINASEAIGENNGAISVSTSAEEFEGEGCQRYGDMMLDENIPRGQYIVIEVADSGVGMDKATITKIFDPFFTTKFTGRGLGMSAVLGIIRGHKGFIRVVSKPGEGTKFIVLLPISREVSTTKKPDGEETVASWRGSGTVLVVDDEETVREVIKGMLEEIGFNVITAEDGQEAVKIFRDHSNDIDCVILDLTMPLKSGTESLLELRKIRKDIPIIICSGYSKEETAQKFITQGVNEFLQKPFLLKTLKNKMRKTLK